MGYFDKIIQVEFSLKELNIIHNIIGNKINTVSNAYEANELMRIASEIENKTRDYIAYYDA